MPKRALVHFLPLLAISLIACGERAPEAPPASVEGEGPTRGAEATPSYSIHEWGLVTARLGDETISAHTRGGLGHFQAPAPRAEGAGAPSPLDALGEVMGPSSGPGHGFGKPVLYVHLGEGVEALRFTADLWIRGGAIYEHWPPAENIGTDSAGGLTGPERIRWDVRATRDACRGRYPAASAGCAAWDHFCELPEVGAYEVDDAACVHVGEESAGVLFYRGGGEIDLPLLVERAGDTGYTLRLREGARLPGRLIHVDRHAGRRGETRVRVLDAPDAGVALDLPSSSRPEAFDANADAGIAALRAELDRLGLTESERDAFLSAWADDLFGPSEAGEQARAVAPHALAPVGNALLYFLPAEATERVAALRFNPPPSELRRALLVRVDLRPFTPPLGLSPYALPLPRRGRVRQRRVEVEGALAQPVVRRVANRYRNQIQHCYRDALGTNPALAGELTLAFTIRGDGRATNPRVARSTLEAPSVERCIMSKVAQWSFPAPESGSVSVTVPYEFLVE